MNIFRRQQPIDIKPLSVSEVAQYHNCSGFVGWHVDVVYSGNLETVLWTPELVDAYKLRPFWAKIEKHNYCFETDVTRVKFLFELKFAKIGYRRAMLFKNRVASQIEKQEVR